MGVKIRSMEHLAAEIAAGVDVTKRHRDKKADDTPEKVAKYKTMVGLRVCKTSKSNNKTTPKPFKSGFRVNTIKAADFIHPVSGNLCFTFLEDNSYVQCYQCRIATPSSLSEQVLDAKEEMKSWSAEEIASVKLEGNP